MDDKYETQIKLIKDFSSDINPNSRTTAKKPKISFYEGLDGIEKTYEHTLSSKDTMKSWASFGPMHETLPDYFKTYYDRRIKKGIHVQSINPDSPEARERHSNDKKELRESVLIPNEVCEWIPQIKMYDNFVNIVSWQEKFAILIESQEIANALKAIFDLSYEACKDKYDPDTNNDKES